MTGPVPRRDAPAGALSTADRLLLAASFVLLFAAPVAGSAGVRGAMLALAAGTLVVSRGRRLAEDFRSVPRAVAIALLAWSGLALASVAWSTAPHFSLEEIRSEVGYGMLAFAILFIAARHLGRWRAWWVAILGGTVAVFLVMIAQQVLSLRLSRHPIEGGPGPWSTHLVLAAPWLLLIVWPRPHGFDRGTVAKAMALAMLLAAVALTGNRIIWAALGAELAVLLAISGAMPAMAPERIAMLRRLTLFAAIALALGFAASVLEKNARYYRQDSSVTASIDRDVRPAIWSVALGELRAAPWLGRGFGREIAQEKFIPLGKPGPGEPLLQHAHNVFLDVALQLGAAGLLAFLAMIGALAREFHRCLGDERTAPWGVVGLAILAGFVVKNLTDDFFYRHNALVFWAMNGMLLGLADRARAAGRAASA